MLSANERQIFTDDSMRALQISRVTRKKKIKARRIVTAPASSVAMQHKLYCTTWKYVEIELCQQALTLKQQQQKHANIAYN